jgi:hypothetical protein
LNTKANEGRTPVDWAVDLQLSLFSGIILSHSSSS